MRGAIGFFSLLGFVIITVIMIISIIKKKKGLKGYAAGILVTMLIFTGNVYIPAAVFKKDKAARNTEVALDLNSGNEKDVEATETSTETPEQSKGEENRESSSAEKPSTAAVSTTAPAAEAKPSVEVKPSGNPPVTQPQASSKKPDYRRRHSAELPPVDANLITTTGDFFKDRDLEIAVRIQINKYSGPLTQSDLNGVTELAAIEDYIDDLTGIENLKSLKKLSLSYNSITDLNPLKSMTTLESLILGVNKITDITPLKNLTNLTFINLNKNNISDIRALANLPNLTHLIMTDNQISDIEPLRNLNKLELLWLNGNNITDFSPVASYYNNLPYKDFELNVKP